MALGDKLFTPAQLGDLSQYLIDSGADPAKVASDLGVSNEKAKPGAIAQKRLDALKGDPQWVSKFHNGDADAAAEFHRLTGMIAFQGQKDVQDELARSREAALKQLADNT
jgi:hypothetical protein